MHRRRRQRPRNAGARRSAPTGSRNALSETYDWTDQWEYLVSKGGGAAGPSRVAAIPLAGGRSVPAAWGTPSGAAGRRKARPKRSAGKKRGAGRRPASARQTRGRGGPGGPAAAAAAAARGDKFSGTREMRERLWDDRGNAGGDVAAGSIPAYDSFYDKFCAVARGGTAKSNFRRAVGKWSRVRACV
jgi:hypothetical protein